MKVYVVFIRPDCCEDGYIDRVFSSKEKAVEYAVKKTEQLQSQSFDYADYEIEEREVC